MYDAALRADDEHRSEPSKPAKDFTDQWQCSLALLVSGIWIDGSYQTTKCARMQFHHADRQQVARQ